MGHALGGFYGQVGAADRPEDVQYTSYARLLPIVHGISGLDWFPTQKFKTKPYQLFIRLFGVYGFALEVVPAPKVLLLLLKSVKNRGLGAKPCETEFMCKAF